MWKTLTIDLSAQPQSGSNGIRHVEARAPLASMTRVRRRRMPDGETQKVHEVLAQGKFGRFRPISVTNLDTGTVEQPPLNDPYEDWTSDDRDAWPEYNDLW